MNNFLLKYLLFCICIGYVMSAKAQNYINGRILDIQNKGLDAAVVVKLQSEPEVQRQNRP